MQCTDFTSVGYPVGGRKAFVARANGLNAASDPYQGYLIERKRRTPPALDVENNALDYGIETGVYAIPGNHEYF